MATQQQINDIAGLYVAYFDRAPDPAGLQFWIDQLDNGRDFSTISQDFATSEEAKEIYPFLATPDLVSTSPAAFVTSIYANLFGRAPDAAGLNFWVGVLGNGSVVPGDMVEAIMLGAQDTLVNGQLIQDKTTIENKIDCALEFTVTGASTEGFVFDAEAYSAARQSIEGVDATDASIAAAKAATFQYFADFVDVTTFTLCENEVLISEATAGQAVTNKVLYWGYNPHSHDETDGVDNLDGNNPDGNDNNLTNEGPEDGGIPADAFFGPDGYLNAIASQYFVGLDASGIDVDNDTFSIVDFANLEEINVSAGDAGIGGTITFTYSDGTADDIALGQAYYDFLCKLILDEEGNTRFFEKEVAAQIPVYMHADGTLSSSQIGAVDLDLTDNGLTPIGYVDAVLGGTGAVYANLPIVLTTAENNGGTHQSGFTTAADDTIVAGQLELLHTAIIDGGQGYNTLEVDAKGHFAQPKLLANIQQVTITNLPNVYTDSDGDSNYPDFGNGASGYQDSILDLSRATEIENVTITEGDYDYLGGNAAEEPGTIVVTGLRNDATLTLQGGFQEDVYVRTGAGFTADGFTVILENVSAYNSMYISDNSPTLNLVSQGGGNSIDGLFYYEDNRVTDLVISGNAHLFIESDLDEIMDTETPLSIDASANTGGVDLNLGSGEKVTFVGSQADDRFAVDTGDSTNTAQGPDFSNDEAVTITNTAGDNYYDIETYALELTDGDGDINVELSVVQGTISLGDGDNHVEGSAVNLVATAGDGDNKFDVRGFDSPQTGPWTFEDDFPTLVDLTAGDGSNIFNIFVDGDDSDGGHFLASATVNVTAGNGGNLVQIPALPYDEEGVLSTVTVNTGSGADTILVGASDITINSGGGGDTITLLGIDNDYVTSVNENKEFSADEVGAVLNIDTGAGSATINLGAYFDDAFLISGAIIAMEGSVITGEDITLFVNTDADLRAADLSGITSIVMDDDSYGYSGQGFPEGATSGSGAASLTLLDTQVVALGEDVFSTQGQSFGAQSVLTIVVTQDAVLSELLDLDAWNPSVKFCFVVEDGVTLTLSAEELHKYVAPEGIYVTNTNGYNDNQVIITNAGPNFDAYNDQNGGTGAGTVQGTDPGGQKDVTVKYVPGGYERPEEDDSVNVIEWNSDDTPVINDTTWPFANDLTITGDADLTINGDVDLSDNFTIDFADFGGNFTEVTPDGVQVVMTITDFQDITGDANLPDNIPNNGIINGLGTPNPSTWGSITGNGTSAAPVRINIEVADGSSVGDSDLGVTLGGFKSSGVQQYIVTDILDSDSNPQSQAAGGEVFVVVCDQTEDLEVLGVQNNRNGIVNFLQVNWGTEILLEGDGYANSSEQEKNLGNPDLSEVGQVNANFFESGANAVVRITNQGVELGANEDNEDGYDDDGERVLDVDGIAVSNADRLRIVVEDGDAVIHDVSGIDVERVIVTGPEDVKIFIDGVSDIAEGSVGVLDAQPNQGFDSSDLVSIDGSGVAGEFSICFTDDADLSGVTLTGIDAITLVGDVNLIMTADQVEALGGIISSDNTGTTTLSVVDMADQPLDLSAIDVDNISTVTFVDEAVTVDPSTDFGGADTLVIPEDSEVTMTYAQFQTADGDDDGEPNVIDGDGSANADDNKLILTDIPNGEALGATPVENVDLDDVAADVDVDIVFDNFTANAQFDVSAAGGETTTAVISGTTDLSAALTLGTVDCVVLQDGAELTLSQAQVQALLAGAAELSDVIKLAPGASATLNINGIDGTGAALDLNDLVADWEGGLNIGTLTIDNTDANVTLTGWTTGGADEIVMPTADVGSPEFGTESTSLTLTANQFHDLDGIGFISGDGLVNLIDVANNNDGPDAGLEPDTLIIDTSGITAPHGTLTFLEVGAGVTSTGETVTLNEVSDISGFEVILSDGQLIRFSTEGQADGAIISENLTVTGNPTGVVWLFTTVSGPLDTSGYSFALNTLFVDEALVNGVNEEDLWTTLAGSIVVEKFNDGAPNALVVFNRINTFEAFGAAPDGITFDDQGEFQTTGSLTLNLEGNVNLGDVTIDDTNGEAAFQALTINSYLDIENLPASIDPGINDTTGLTANGGAQLIDGYIIQPNQVGDIHLNAPVASGETVLVTLNTSDEQNDAAIANGTTGAGSGTDLDAGQPLEIGTIFMGTPAAGENSATIDINGLHDVTIEAIDMSDPALTLVTVDTLGILEPPTDADVVIDGVNYGDLADTMGFLAGPTDGLNAIQFVDGFVATATDDFFVGGGTPDMIFNVVGGANDFTAMDDGSGLAASGFSPATGFYVSGPGTIKLTAAQLQQIGIEDANSDGVADNFVLAPGLTSADVTIDICELTSSTGPLDLDAIQAAGFNIGTITLVDDGGTTVIDLDNGTTLGGADQIVMELDEESISLELTADQYNGFSGVIVEDRSGTALTDASITGTVIIDDLEAIENATTGEVTIDVTGVATTGDNTFFLQDANNEADANAGGVGNSPTNDVTFSAASDLSGFSVTLYDVDSTGTPDQLEGQTIRFSTEVQADGRVVLVLDPDGTNPNKDEMDTNVVWLFNTVTGGLDVSGYAATLGRIWISDELVDSVLGDIDGLFTIDNPDNPGTPLFTLDSNIIKRIETADLDALLQLNVPINQRVEIAAFTPLAGAEFTITDPLVSISTLRMDFGGAATIGNLLLDNVLGPVDPVNTNFPGDDDFQLLEINSILANNPDHYLLPDGWTTGNPLPSNDLYADSFENNTVGDIASGPDRGVLHTIRINTFENDTTDVGVDETDADFVGTNVYNSASTGFDAAAETLGREGAQFVAGTIYFSDDGDTTAEGGDTGTPQATLILTGENDVTVKSLDTSDAEITSLVVDLLAYSGTFTVTGGSPAFDGDNATDDTTTTLTIIGSASSVMTLASTVTTDDDGSYDSAEDFISYNVGTGNTVPFSGVSSGALEEIDVTGMLGTISLGTISQINSEEFTLNAAGAGQVFARIGRGLDDGVEEVPELSATGVWTVNGTSGGYPNGDGDFGGVNNVDLVIDEVVLNNGGQLSLTDVDLCISGDVDLSVLDAADLTFGGAVTVVVAAGGNLTLSTEQAHAIATAFPTFTITGEGTLTIVGDADDVDFGDLLGTGTVDMSGTTITAGDASGAVDYELQGAMNKDGDWITQNVIGSADNDAVTFDGAVDGAASTLTDGFAFSLALGDDDGSIGDPSVVGTTDDATEVVGDVVDVSGLDSGDFVQYNVDAGFDEVDVIETGDQLQVQTGAELQVLEVDDFVATADDTNDGTAVLVADVDGTIDMSDAGGANGWTLIGAADADTGFGNTLTGSDQDDVFVDGAADSTDTAADGNFEEGDTFTGNGGEDLFQFNVASSTPATFASTPIQAASDVEYIDVTTAGTDAAGALLTIEYQLNNVTTVAVVNDANVGGSGVDFTSQSSIAAGIAAVMNGINGISASVDAGDNTQVNLVGANGNLLNINSITANAAAGTAAAVVLAAADDDPDNTDDAADTGDDDAQITDIAITGTVTEGEIYFLTVTLRDGSEIEAQYEAQFGDTVNDVAAGLLTNGDTTGINQIAPALSIDATIPGALNVIRITDENDDNGGFNVTLSAGQAVLNASSASSVLDGTETSLADADADVITDFLDDDDFITFGLDAGSNDNYDEAAYEDSFALAHAAADAAFAGDADLIYFLTGSNDIAATDGGPTGLLFVNANNDGTADTVVALTGVTEANFDDSNIV